MNCILKCIHSGSEEIIRLNEINHTSFLDNELTEINDLFESERNSEIIGIYINGVIVGFFFVRSYKEICYIGYFAIAPEHRGKGIGGKALKLLAEYYSNKQLVVEIEAVDEKAHNNYSRIRRKNFYLKNGFVPTNWHLFYDEVELEILCSGADFKKNEFNELSDYIHSLYYDSIPKLYQK